MPRSTPPRPPPTPAAATARCACCSGSPGAVWPTLPRHASLTAVTATLGTAHSDGESGGESEDDTLAGYASRLAAEAHGRIGRSATAARSDSDEQDEDSESVAIDAPMKEMLQKLFGGADGEVVEVKIVVGGEGDVVGGRGGGSATGAIDGLVEHFARVAAAAGTDDDDSS